MTHREGLSLDTCNLEVGHFSVLCGICHDKDVTRRLSIWFRDAVAYRVRFLRVRILCNNDGWFAYPFQEFEDLPLVCQHLKRLELCALEKLTLQLFSERPPHKVQLKGSINLRLRYAAISEHLKTVEINCEFVDEKILKVLKFLRMFNLFHPSCF
ncbi:hypothetical protein PR202_ga24626 [Eleusine coracana subsp. coracana]|uniref:Uncharacterized protein n=1 Tax=Eleusine coracana subsp. coracana TaxID=191504 RepID=A0AAV5D8E9_ELECO|nr:hypothetical protein PR202_ga24626 [Eleusine coracana subsp. coracana]